MELDFFWVTVSDLERAEEFYNEFLQQEPESRSNRMVYYELENIGFGLYNPDADPSDWEPTRGDSSAPAFRVENLEEEKERMQQLAEIHKEYDAGDHIGFLVADPDGNVLEVYSCER